METIPVIAVVDPELMTSVPPALTAYQGFDALFHSTEGYLNKKANALGDLFALKAIELLAKSLPAAVHEGDNLEARTDVALASTLSGMNECVASSLSAHALEHEMSAFNPKLPHGAGLIMISREYYAYFAKSGACDQKNNRDGKETRQKKCRPTDGLRRCARQSSKGLRC